MPADDPDCCVTIHSHPTHMRTRRLFEAPVPLLRTKMPELRYPDSPSPQHNSPRKEIPQEKKQARKDLLLINPFMIFIS